MKKLLFVLLICCTGSLMAQPRERMEYVLHYGFIRGGKAVLMATDTTYNDKPAIHFYLQGNTTGLADNLFSVHDIYESVVDPETYLPYKAIRNIKERKYRYYNEAFFYNENDSLFSQRSGGKKVPHNLVDMLTAFFYLRQNNFLDKLDEGEEFTIPVFHSDEYFIMTAKFMGTDKIKSDMGVKECYILSPRVKKGKLLKRSDGLMFYITKDKNRIPLLLEFDMFIGALKAELVSYKKNGVEQIKK